MAGRMITRIKEIIKPKSKPVSVYDHLFEKIDPQKVYKESHPSFQEVNNNKVNQVLSLLSKMAKESKTSDGNLTADILLKKIDPNKRTRVLLENNDVLLQYLKSLGKSGVEFGLVLKKSRKNYDLRVLSINRPESYKHSSVIRFHLSNILEELGVETIRPVYSSFDPKTKIDISVYESIKYKKELISEIEKENLLKELEKRYQKLFSKHPELKGTSLIKISSDLFDFGSKNIFRITDGPKAGTIVVDTRISN